MVEDKTDAYIAPHVPQLQKLLEKSAATDEVSLVEAQKPVLERIFRVIPDPPPEEDADGEQRWTRARTRRPTMRHRGRQGHERDRGDRRARRFPQVRRESHR